MGLAVLGMALALCCWLTQMMYKKQWVKIAVALGHLLTNHIVTVAEAQTGDRVSCSRPRSENVQAFMHAVQEAIQTMQA